MTNLDRFMQVYEKHLRAAIAESPSEYLVTDLSILVPRMRAAIERGSMNKDSVSFRRTCKELNIAHTYAAIKNFIGGTR